MLNDIGAAERAETAKKGPAKEVRPPPLCGIAARSEGGRRRLQHSLRGAVPATLSFDLRGWWSAEDAGVAMYRPDLRATEPASALALAGSLYAPGRIDDFGCRADKRIDNALFEDLLQTEGSALAKLRGEFAIALWDGKRNRLMLGRDPLGQRSLFIRSDDDFVVWCSELAPLLEDPAFSCELDFESAFHYLSSGLPPPWHTMARGVRRIPAGHLVRWDPGSPLLAQRYWTPLNDDSTTQIGATSAPRISSALDDAVAVRLDKPGPQALLLSGGLDSSFLAATAASALGADRLQAYTIEFSAEYGRNEVGYARLVARASRMRHRVVPLHARDALPLLAATLNAAEPCSAWAAITHRHLLRSVREDGHSHLISGLGSDEVFAGYRILLDYYFRSRRRLQRWPAQRSVDSFDALLWDRSAARRNLYPGVASFFVDSELQTAVLRPYRGWQRTTYLEQFYRECRQIKPGAHVFEMMIAHECQHRIPDLLFAGFEPIGRELGVRTAYPFLDASLLKLVCGLGPTSRYEYESGIWWNKMMLRGIASRRLPVTIVSRSPTSYTAPFAEWMREPVFARPTMARLKRSRFWRAGLVRPDLLVRLVSAMGRDTKIRRARQASWVNQLWALLTLCAWYDRYVERVR